MIRALAAAAVNRRTFRAVLATALCTGQTLHHSNTSSNHPSRQLRILSAFLCSKSSPETDLTSTERTACSKTATQAHEFADPLVGRETNVPSDIEEEIDEKISSSDDSSEDNDESYSSSDICSGDSESSEYSSEDNDPEKGSLTCSDHNEEDDPETSSIETMDMSDIPEELKEMLQDGYIIEDLEENVSFDSSSELLTIDEVKQVLEEVRARDVQIFPVQDRCEWTDMMVVATGISDRHVRGIAEALVYKFYVLVHLMSSFYTDKKKGQVESSLYPTIEGQAGGKWLVVDCGNIIIHVLNEESRAYYKLEDMWSGDLKPSTADEDFEKMLGKVGLTTVSR